MSAPIFTHQALGTTWWIEIFDDLPQETRTTVYNDCALFLTEFEHRYSRFRPDSLISILNRERSITHPPAELITLLTCGLDLHRRSNGMFNILVGDTLLARGYDADYSFAVTTPPSYIPEPAEAISITKETISLSTGSIDVGGFGKGYAIDLLATRLKQKFTLSGFLINGGGDMFGTTNNGQPITIYLEHPTTADTYLATTTLHNQGFAASSPHKRSWQYKGVAYTHIVDTVDTLNTREKPDAVFIKAASATDADAFATIGLIATDADMNTFATNEKIGLATFNLSTSTLSNNQAFTSH